MTANVGRIDRIVRIVLGLAILSLLFLLEGNLRFFGLIGLVPLMTALVGWCPAYSLFGLSSCARRESGGSSGTGGATVRRL
jgi:Inner membrane protein YgaP-like, transmembrane domain